MNIAVILTDIQADENALHFAGLLARVTNSEITLLLVVPAESNQSQGEQVLSQAKHTLSDLSVNTSLCIGKRVSRVLSELRENAYQIIVIGEGQKTVIAQQNQRQLIRAIINRASASVVIVRQPRKTLERILICTGGMQVAEPVIQAGAYLARNASAQVTLLHVAGTIPSMYTGLGEIDETLSELLKTDTPTAKHLRQSARLLEKYGVTAEMKLRHGVVANEILREAARSQADLIVIGAPEQKKRFKKWLLGDVTGAILERSLCPVLIAKAGLGDPPEST
ncbi:MAG TPA: universal stress protein [Anaerolineales bacterium]